MTVMRGFVDLTTKAEHIHGPGKRWDGDRYTCSEERQAPWNTDADVISAMPELRPTDIDRLINEERIETAARVRHRSNPQFQWNSTMHYAEEIVTCIQKCAECADSPDLVRQWERNLAGWAQLLEGTTSHPLR